MESCPSMKGFIDGEPKMLPFFPTQERDNGICLEGPSILATEEGFLGFAHEMDLTGRGKRIYGPKYLSIPYWKITDNQ